ncbi:MAG: ATP synthase F1 subunit gamma [Acidobacteriota bacterium]
MANRRAIVKRRKAVRNIKKITRTMQLIATARFQSAMNRAVRTRPYTDKLAELIEDLSGVTGDYEHPLMQPSDSKRSALVVLTSNRGLCGGYNANVIRTANAHLKAQKASGLETDVYMVGRKGLSAFKFSGRDVERQILDIDDKPRFEQVEPIAQELIDEFTAGRLGSVYVAYMRFYSPGKQLPEIFQLLPLSREETAGEAEEETGAQGIYEIQPSPEELLERLLPAAVRMRLFQSFNDAAVSEQIARMAAMKAATEAAEEMIGNLTREYNRARQSQITLELLDIVGGANALA